jgi:hypothetical protein
MNTWNYRVVRHVEGDETFYAFHEAHYGEDKETPESVSVSPAYAQGETIEALAGELEKFRAALEKPVIDFSDFARGEGGRNAWTQTLQGQIRKARPERLD